jgi:homocysteine S-methyltransferase
MERSWLERLHGGDVVVLDGATGSELRRRGVSLSEDIWSGRAAYDHAALLRDIHADYIRAGADIITTNTFATSRFVLESAGLGSAFETINRHAVNAALEAREVVAERPVAVAGSMSCFPPRFDPAAYPSHEAERTAYRELAALLADAGVDLIALEMIQDIGHGGLALDAALETGLPVCLGLSARRGDDGLVAYDYPRQRFEPILQPLLERDPTVVAIMHTPPDVVGDALRALTGARWRGPTGAWPEVGTFGGPGEPAGVLLSPAGLAAAAAGWIEQGARLLGGCCGTGPEHIAALAALREQRRDAGR